MLSNNKTVFLLFICFTIAFAHNNGERYSTAHNFFKGFMLGIGHGLCNKVVETSINKIIFSDAICVINHSKLLSEKIDAINDACNFVIAIPAFDCDKNRNKTLYLGLHLAWNAHILLTAEPFLHFLAKKFVIEGTLYVPLFYAAYRVRTKYCGDSLAAAWGHGIGRYLTEFLNITQSYRDGRPRFNLKLNINLADAIWQTNLSWKSS